MLENTKFKTGVDYYHRLNLVFNLMIAVPLLPFSVIYLGSLKGMVIALEISSQLNLIIDVISTCFIMGLSYYAFHRYKIERAAIYREKGLRTKMTLFYSCLVRTYLYLVIGGCISVSAFSMTYSKIHIVTFVALLVLFSLKRPSLKLIVEELQLVGEDSKVLRNREIIRAV